MNSDNNTIVSAEMLKRLREQGLGKGYTAVPDEFADKAHAFLGGREIADIDEPTKKDFNEKRERYLLQQEREAAGNLRHEEARREALESEIVKAQKGRV